MDVVESIAYILLMIVSVGFLLYYVSTYKGE